MNRFSKVILVFAVISLVYSISLDRTPVYLNRDELGFSLNAYSIARGGFDENGRFLPLYFWHSGVMWATPIIVYLTALFLTILPLSEITIRLPAVVIGLLDIILIFFLAKKLFQSEKYGLLAATLLALTPVHFIQSRILLDNIFPVPFVLGWVILLYLFFSKRNLWFLFFSGILLGLGIHSYHASKVIMPIYILFTFWLILFRYKGKKRIILIPAVGFILLLLPLVSWLSQYPDTLTDQVRYTGLYDTKLNAFQGLITLLTPEKLGQMFLVYLKYFDPVFLFLKGDSSLIHSTGIVGVFLLSYVFLIPIGIYQALKNKSWFNLLLLVGFFTAPLAAALVMHEYRASKELFILPFATLLATLGVKVLLSSNLNNLRFFCIILLILIPMQFSLFLYDYFNDYRARSYLWFDYNILGALDGVLEEDNKNKANAIYFDSRIYYYTDRYWKFNLIKHNKEDLLDKTQFFDPLFKNKLYESNTILLYRFDHINTLPLQEPQFRLVRTISEPDGVISFYIYRN